MVLESSVLRDTAHSKAGGKHLIAALRGSTPGATLIVVGSIHGNEPAGALAVERVLAGIQQRSQKLHGELILLYGNTRALARNIRYIDSDLNRHWTEENILAARAGAISPSPLSEDLELRELLGEFEQAMERARGEIYFLDLHTTSAHGLPFATVGDTLRNRRFALQFPATIVLGLEEQIEGTLLEYMNNLGVVTMGFEAGQHEAESSIEHHQALIWMALVAARLLPREDVPEFESSRAMLERASGGGKVVEIRHRHAISPGDEFKMKPGFENFQTVRRGQILAEDRRGAIKARESGMVLLPLYQKLGDDGFFLGREVKSFWLKLSAALRHLKVGDYVHWLPGVRRQAHDGSSFVVNTRIARILPLQVFHLLGFRKRRWNNNLLIVSRRRFDLTRPVIKR